MTGRTKVVVTAVAVLCSLAAVGLTVVALMVDLDTADRAASVIGAVVGLAGLVVSLFSLHRTEAGSPVEAGGARSIAVGGSIAFAATGDRLQGARPVDPAVVPALPVPSGDAGGEPAGPVRSPGERSIAAGRDIGFADTGDGGRTA
ncbi:hypothetical protein [Streptomyces griseocarneus]|uniref:hypothetical protein n=1 Tax=Streptomyces griseocarneus TaxID=51201 RepID=UPI00167C6A3E|nr:hypothetical protein [Streptomyces griseocarneus]MBZ6475845.1 hypothetical protein [Streptomyces griseocarneus]GHG50448.1 hypothetical protein GCM10018779_10560 [Streptomyces griseocarneus]